MKFPDDDAVSEDRVRFCLDLFPRFIAVTWAKYGDTRDDTQLAISAEISFMRFLSLKIQRPFICFCKPSPHIYTSEPLKLENAPSNLVDVPDAPHKLSAETTDLKDESLEQKKQQQTANSFKSSIKRPVMETQKPPKKKQVQWMDLLGKELVDIREFESSDVEDMDSEAFGHKGCICM